MRKKGNRYTGRFKVICQFEYYLYGENYSMVYETFKSVSYTHLSRSMTIVSAPNNQI